MRSIYRAGLAAVAVFGASAAAPAYAQAQFSGAGDTAELDCDGGSARIEGASNTLTIHGPCTGLTLEGAGNRIRIEMAPQSSISISGASNQVQWSAPPKVRPRVRVSGAGNRVWRAD